MKRKKLRHDDGSPFEPRSAIGSDGDYDYEFVYDDHGNVLSFTATVKLDGNRVVGPPITSTSLKTVPLAGMVRSHAGALRRHPSVTSATIEPPERTPGGRLRLSDYDYALIAELYVEKARTSTKPLEDVVAELPWLGYATARNAIRHARQRGMLTPTVRGRPGGELTPKAVELLDDERLLCTGMPGEEDA